MDARPEIGRVPGLRERRAGGAESLPLGELAPAGLAPTRVLLHRGPEPRLLGAERLLEIAATRTRLHEASSARKAPAARELPLQPPPGLEEQGARGVLRDVEDLARLPVREALDLAEQEGRALALVEPRERRLDREAQRMVGLARGERDLRGKRSLGAPAAAPQLVVAGVDQDPVDPGREGGAAAKTRDPAIDLQKRVLDRVLGVGALPRRFRAIDFIRAPCSSYSRSKAGSEPCRQPSSSPSLAVRISRPRQGELLFRQ